MNPAGIGSEAFKKAEVDWFDSEQYKRLPRRNPYCRDLKELERHASAWFRARQDWERKNPKKARRERWEEHVRMAVGITVMVTIFLVILLGSVYLQISSGGTDMCDTQDMSTCAPPEPMGWR